MSDKHESPESLVEDARKMGMEVCDKCKAVVVDGKCNCDAATEDAKEKQSEKEEETQEVPQVSPLELLEKIPGAPSKEQIGLWKQQYKAVYVLPFMENEVYIWRPLIRGEWMALLNNEQLASNEKLMQERVVNQALLWPKMTDPIVMQSTRAGVIPTLFSVIMTGSLFIPAEVAANMVVEL